MTTLHIIGFVLCILAIITLGYFSGKKVSTGSDYISGSGKGGLLLVTGVLFSTNIGGASTIGAAQGAFTGGLYGMWWNVGVFLANFVIGLCLAKHIKSSGCVTMQQFIRIKYGSKAALTSAVLSSIGVLVSIVTQILSATALLMSILKVSFVLATAIATVLMIIYVIFGGAIGAGMVGIAKAGLLFVFCIVGGIIVIRNTSNIPGGFSNLDPNVYFNLNTGGILNNIGGVISSIVGLAVSQVFFTCFSTAKDVKTGQRACYIASLLILPISIASVAIGMYMQLTHPEISSKEAFPSFLLMNLNPFLSGVALATLLITVVGSGASVTLGIATVISKDLYGHFKPNANEKEMLYATRLAIILVLIVAFIFTCLCGNSYISLFTMLSMALRAAVNFVPVMLAFFSKKIIGEKHCLSSMYFGIVSYLAVYFVSKSTMYALLASIIVALVPIMLKNKKQL